MKKTNTGMSTKEVEVILYGLALIMFLVAMQAISKGDIWSFLSSFGTSLAFAFSPKEPDFYKSPIRKWSDLNSITFSTDVLSGAILMVAFIFIVVGIVGRLFFS